MTNCSPGTSINLTRTDTILKPQRIDVKNLTLNGTVPLNLTFPMPKYSKKKQNLSEVQKNKLKVVRDNKQEYVKNLGGNETIHNDGELSTVKTQVWLNKLPQSTDVSTFIIVCVKCFQLYRLGFRGNEPPYERC